MWGHLVVVLISYICSYLILSVWASTISIYFYSVCQCPGPGSVLNPKWLSYLIGINLCCSNINKNLYFCVKHSQLPRQISSMWIFSPHVKACDKSVFFTQFGTFSRNVFQIILREAQIWKGFGCSLTIEALPGALLQLYPWLINCYSKNNSCLSLESQVPKRTIIFHFVKWFLQSFGMLA